MSIVNYFTQFNNLKVSTKGLEKKNDEKKKENIRKFNKRNNDIDKKNQINKKKGMKSGLFLYFFLLLSDLEAKLIRHPPEVSSSIFRTNKTNNSAVAIFSMAGKKPINLLRSSDLQIRQQQLIYPSSLQGQVVLYHLLIGS